MAKKNNYEEQRAAELAYAEEYRRRLRRSKPTSTPDDETARRLDEERRTAEAEREATVERERSEAEARRRRTEELIGRTRPSVVEDLALELMPEEEWTPIQAPDKSEECLGTGAEKANTEPAASRTSYRVTVDGASVSHSLYIEGMTFTGAIPTGDAVTPAETEKRKGRVYGRGVIYDEYGFEGEDVATSDTVGTAPSDTAEDGTAPHATRLASKSYRDIESIPETVEYEDQEHTSATIDESHAEDLEYSAFLKREREMSGGVSNNSDPRDTYKPTYNAPEMAADEPESRVEPPSEMDEEEAMLSYVDFYHEMDKRTRESARSADGTEYKPEYDIGSDEHTELASHATEDSLTHEAAARREADRRLDERETRREMEREMLDFVKSEERAKRTRQNGQTATSPSADTVAETLVFDKRALTRRKKTECENDIALIEARLGSEIAAIESQRDKLEFTFGDGDARDKREDKKNLHRLKELKAKLANAKKFESADNERYYQIILTDLARAKMPGSADMKRVIQLREKLTELLRRRDELNSRLIELYLGRERGKRGGFEARTDAARKARRKEYGKRLSLARRIKREKVAYDYKLKLHELLNSQVRLAGDIAECKHILSREKPKGEAAREVRRKLADLDREYRKNEKEIDRVSKTAFKQARDKKEKKKGEVLGWIGLVILLAIIGVVIWQWENISLFISENIPSIEQILPDTPADDDSDGPEDNPLDGDDSGTETPTDEDGSDGEPEIREPASEEANANGGAL